MSTPTSERTPARMIPELREEIQTRVDIQLESQDDWEEGETRTQEEMEIVALDDIVRMEADCGGLFEQGLIPEFEGPPEWVAEMKAKQTASLRDMERQRQEWLRLWRAAKRELKRRTAAGKDD